MHNHIRCVYLNSLYLRVHYPTAVPYQYDRMIKKDRQFIWIKLARHSFTGKWQFNRSLSKSEPCVSPSICLHALVSSSRALQTSSWELHPIELCLFLLLSLPFQSLALSPLQKSLTSSSSYVFNPQEISIKCAYPRFVRKTPSLILHQLYCCQCLSVLEWWSNWAAGVI